MRKLLLLVTMLVACGGPVDGDDAGDDQVDGGLDVDADPFAPDADPFAPDADPGTPDAAAGLPYGYECDVLVDDECAAGLTCRLADAQGNGACRMVGEVDEGEACAVFNVFDAATPCGAAMACYGDANGVCMVLCDPDAPQVRCAAGQSCDPVANDVVGLCD